MNRDEVLKWIRRFEEEAVAHETTARDFSDSDEFRSGYGDDFVRAKAEEYHGKARSARDFAEHLKNKWLK